jgi:hypothetical protein
MNYFVPCGLVTFGMFIPYIDIVITRLNFLMPHELVTNTCIKGLLFLTYTWHPSSLFSHSTYFDYVWHI